MCSKRSSPQIGTGTEREKCQKVRIRIVSSLALAVACELIHFTDKAAIIYNYDNRIILKFVLGFVTIDFKLTDRRWDPYFVRSLTRFSDKGEVPALSAKQLEAMQVLEEIANREALHMVLEVKTDFICMPLRVLKQTPGQVGDIQLVSGTFVLHARTAYTDHLPPAPKRQLMRLWLSTPESQGGWKLPFCGTCIIALNHLALV